MNKIKIITTLTHEFKPEDINDLIVGALEGGINYWCKKANVNKLANDSIIKTNEAIRFTNGSDYQYFKKEGSRFIAGAMAGDVFIPLLAVRFRGLNNYKYEVVK
jgi:hypothetical protein